MPMVPYEREDYERAGDAVEMAQDDLGRAYWVDSPEHLRVYLSLVLARVATARESNLSVTWADVMRWLRDCAYEVEETLDLGLEVRESVQGQVRDVMERYPPDSDGEGNRSLNDYLSGLGGTLGALPFYLHSMKLLICRIPAMMTFGFRIRLLII